MRKWWNGIHSGLRSQRPSGLRVRVSPYAPKFFARFVYRLGHGPFKAGRRVRFPYRVPSLLNGCAEHWRAQAAVTRPHTNKSVLVQLQPHPPSFQGRVAASLLLNDPLAGRPVASILES